MVKNSDYWDSSVGVGKTFCMPPSFSSLQGARSSLFTQMSQAVHGLVSQRYSVRQGVRDVAAVWLLIRDTRLARD